MKRANNRTHLWVGLLGWVTAFGVLAWMLSR